MVKKSLNNSIQIQLLLEKDVNLEYAVNVCCSNPIASGKIDSAMWFAPLEHLRNVVTGYYSPIGVNLNMLNSVY